MGNVRSGKEGGLVGVITYAALSLLLVLSLAVHASSENPTALGDPDIAIEPNLPKPSPQIPLPTGMVSDAPLRHAALPDFGIPSIPIPPKPQGIGDRIATIPTPSPNGESEGLAFDGANLWVSGGGGTLYYINPRDGSIIRTLTPTPTGQLFAGLTWDGQYLWAGTYSRRLLKIDSVSGAILENFPAYTRPNPVYGEHIFGLAYDSTTNTLWYSDYTDILVNVDMNGNLIQTREYPPMHAFHGEEYDGICMFHHSALQTFSGDNILQTDDQNVLWIYGYYEAWDITYDPVTFSVPVVWYGTSPPHPGGGNLFAIEVQPCRATCGDGNLDAGEQCDDGNSDPLDECSNCLTTVCGNGIIEYGEQCDGGLYCRLDVPRENPRYTTCTTDADCAGIGDGLCLPRCTAQCTFPGYCPNNVLDPGEECDDGNSINNDGCSEYCTAECYDSDGGLVIAVQGEVLASNWDIQAEDICLSSTLLLEQYCGPECMDQTNQSMGPRSTVVDCTLYGYAACLDGACIPDDGSRAPIELECSSCGDGTLDPGEDCDDGNTIDDETCLHNCRRPLPDCEPGAICACGNGIQDNNEECDLGDRFSGGGNRLDGECTGECKLTFCGDATLQQPNGRHTDGPANDGIEACDQQSCPDGTDCDYDRDCPGWMPGLDLCQSRDTGSCKTDCTLNVCGDGFIHLGVEQCDDGNLIDGDGCEGNCLFTTTDCSDQPGVCGNGIIEYGEQCDDRNTVSEDGCSSLCRYETCTFVPDTGRQITTGNPREEHSDVDGIWAVWDSFSDGGDLGGSDIFLHNLNSGAVRRITDSAGGVNFYWPKVLTINTTNQSNCTTTDTYVLYVGSWSLGTGLYLYSVSRDHTVAFPPIFSDTMPSLWHHDIGIGEGNGLVTWIEASGQSLRDANLIYSLWAYPLDRINWDAAVPIDRNDYILMQNAPNQGHPELDEERPDLVWYSEHANSEWSTILHYDLRFLTEGLQPITINGENFWYADPSHITQLTSDAAAPYETSGLALGDGVVAYVDERNLYHGDLYTVAVDEPLRERLEIADAHPIGFDLDDGILTYGRVTAGMGSSVDQAEIIAWDIATDARQPLYVDADPSDETATEPAISVPTVVWSNVQNLDGDVYCYVLPETIG